MNIEAQGGSIGLTGDVFTNFVVQCIEKHEMLEREQLEKKEQEERAERLEKERSERKERL